MMKQQQIYIIGCGDIGRRVAKLYQQDGITIKALVQSAQSKKQCQQQNITVHCCNLDHEMTMMISNASIFYFVPPPQQGNIDTRLRRFLHHIADKAQRIVLISTSGVYGDYQGDWIDENQPLQPIAGRAIRRVSAEKILQQWAKQYQKAFVILRVPGIYAQDRLPIARLKKGLPVVRETEAGWTNRIHADDLAQICQTAMSKAPNNSVYNVSDDQPSTMTDYFNQVADAVALPRPPQISLQTACKTLSKGMVSYLQESRRINNTKMKQELGIILKYPTLASGLNFIQS